MHRSTIFRRKKKAEILGCSIDELPDGRGKHGNNLMGESHPRWNNGRWTHVDGYIAIKVPKGHHLRMANGYAYEHQIVAEKTMGRSLLPNEDVHHLLLEI